jgi:hypothetical protein
MNSWGIGWTPFWLMLLLGAYHGVNPGMGWLFAVALGMQEKDGRAVGKSLVPIAIGHMFAIGVVVLAAVLLGTALPSAGMRYPVAAVLVGLGIYRFVRHRHPRWVRRQVGFRDLIVWSFLMASAHGAGLMLLPVLLDWPSPSHMEHAGHTGLVASQGPLQVAAAILVHTSGHLLVTLMIAMIVYEKIGVAILRKAWFNLDLVWTLALMLSGVLILLL